MLKITGISAGKTFATIHIDPYMIKFGQGYGRHLLYWRTGNFTKSLIEIGIDKDNFEIVTVAILLADKINLNNNQVIWNNLNQSICEEGIPSCDIKFFLDNQDEFFDDFNEFTFYLNKDSVLIWFGGEDIQPAKCIAASSSVLFGLSPENKLVALEFNNLSEEQVELIRNIYWMST